MAADSFHSSDHPAGGSPAATHFSCLAKKSKQKKRPLGRSPLRGFPASAGINREGKTTRYAQTFFPSFSDLCLPPPATLKRPKCPNCSPSASRYQTFVVANSFVVPANAGIQWRQRITQPSSRRWVPTFVGTTNLKRPEKFEPQPYLGRCAASPSRSPLESSRCQRVKIGLRREKCLSVASCFPFPIFTCWRREPSKRATTQRSPFFAYFLWRSKESE